MKALLVAFILCFRRFHFGEATNKSFSEWYEIGRLAYLDNDWEHCVQGFEKAVQAYKSYQNINLGCKKQCQNQSRDNQDKILQRTLNLIFVCFATTNVVYSPEATNTYSYSDFGCICINVPQYN